MASDGQQVRINGITTVLGSPHIELVNYRVGFFGIERCTLIDNAHYHEDLLFPGNDLVEISTDNFATTKFKGRIAKINPGGLGREGATYEVRGLDWVLNSQFFTKWNGRSEFQYNDQFVTDLSSPRSVTKANGDTITNPADVGTGSITTKSRKARWTVGEMIVDILEHAFGINTPERIGGSSGGPTVSAIPIHHISPASVTDPYAHLFSLGASRDYLDQLTWDATEIMKVLDFWAADVLLREIRLWDAIQQLVQMGGEHGLFIDPTIITKPQLVIYKFTNATTVQIQCGQPGDHIETSNIRAVLDDWEFDLEGMHNAIVIEGRPTVVKTGSTDGSKSATFNPSMSPDHAYSGKLDKLTSNGKVWRLRNQSACFAIGGYFDSNFRSQDITQAEKYGPILWKAGSKLPVEAGVDIKPITMPGSGIVLFDRTMSGDLRLETLMEIPFKVSVGPIAGYSPNRPLSGTGSTALYPTPGPFDAYAETGKKTELHIVLESFVPKEREVDQSVGGFETQPPKNAGKNNGVLRSRRFTARGLRDAGYPDVILGPEDRDDAVFMLLFAEEMQRRMRDIRIKLNLTIDRIDLSGLYDSATLQPGLRKRVSLTGLRRNRWSDAKLQIMSVTVDVENDRMVLECSNDIFSVNGRFRALWRQMQKDQELNRLKKQVKDMRDGDNASAALGIGENQTPRQSNTLIREPDRAGFSVFTEDQQLTTQP